VTSAAARKRLTKRRLVASPDAFPPFEAADAHALQGLSAGTASDVQQKRALDWIIRIAAMTHDNPFRPGRDGATEFLCGRQFVGQAIIEALKWRAPQ
jgi:hypothetical protein